jgi:hypothetical protein
METIKVKIFCLNKEFEIPKVAFIPDEKQKPHSGGKLNLSYIESSIMSQLSPCIEKYNGLITACIVD